jgi:putative membrane protein
LDEAQVTITCQNWIGLTDRLFSFFLILFSDTVKLIENFPMPEMTANPYPPDAQAQLARERNRIAADRSLLSFTRNSLTLISIGIGINQVMMALSPDDPRANRFAYILSLVLIGLGNFNLVFACLDYQQEMKRLKQPEYFFTPRYSLGGVTGLALLIVALLVLGWIVTRVL